MNECRGEINEIHASGIIGTHPGTTCSREQPVEAGIPHTALARPTYEKRGRNSGLAARPNIDRSVCGNTCTRP